MGPSRDGPMGVSWGRMIIVLGPRSSVVFPDEAVLSGALAKYLAETLIALVYVRHIKENDYSQ